MSRLNNTRRRRRQLILSLLIALQYLILTESFLKKLFSRRGRQQRRKATAEEIARRIQLIDIGGGFEIDRTTFFVSLTVVICFSFGILSHIVRFPSLLSSSSSSFWFFRPRKKGGNRPNVDGTVDVIVVGVGLPKKGMGWYHLQQLLTLPTVNVKAIIEPFYLNPQLHPPNNPPPRSWKKFLKATTALGIESYSSTNDLSPFSKPTLCLIAGRTVDNPKFFHQCIDKGASTIYLEKPGATTVDELIRMKEYAAARRVTVYMGYNKHVAPYIQKAVTLANSLPNNAQVSFIHNNDYSEADLPEVFSRNPEGMLKNMAIHELAILVTFFNVTRDNIDHFLVNKNKKYTEKKTVVWGSSQHAIISSNNSSSVNRTTATATNGSSSGSLQQPHNNNNNNTLESRKQQRRWQPRWKQHWQKQQQQQHQQQQQSKTSITDYSRVAFKITTTTGTVVSISANRCTDTPSSIAIVKDSESNKEIKSFHCPDEDTLIKLKNQQDDDPEMMSYFFLQSDDYWELKKRVVDSMIWGGRAKDVATIEEGIEALKLAEYANEQLEKMLI